MTTPDDPTRETTTEATPRQTMTAIPPHVERRRRIFFGIWGAIALATLFLFRAVLLPFFLAMVVAYVLTPVVSRLERIRVAGRGLPRWGAVVVVYLGLLGMLSLLVAVGAPRLAAESQKLARDVPAAVAGIRDDVIPRVEGMLRRTMAQYSTEPSERTTPEGASPSSSRLPREERRAIEIRPLGEQGTEGYEVALPPGGIVITPEGEGYQIAQRGAHEAFDHDVTETVLASLRGLTKNTEDQAATVLRTAQAVVRAVVKGVFTFFIMLMLSAYLIMTRESVVAFVRSLVWPTRRSRFDRLITRMDRGLSGVVRGQLLICLVNGVLSGIGFYLLDLRYWPVLTLVATVFSIIPIFGAILSSIPAVIIGLQDSPGTGFAVFAWIIVIHQIEANLLNPKILGDAAQVHPVLVVFALLAGEHLFGIAGALLAVPVLSLTQSLFLHNREVMNGMVEEPEQPPTQPAAAPASA